MRRYEDGTFKPIDKQKREAGRKGGLATGDSKKRLGASNGRYSEGRERHPCCGAIKGRSHKKTCPNHRSNKIARALRKESITPKVTPSKIVIDPNFIESAPVISMLYNVSGVCVGCNATINAHERKKVHKSDITSNPMRVMCRKCA